MQGPSTFGTDYLAFLLAFRALANHEFFLNRGVAAIRYSIHDMAAVFARVLPGFLWDHHLLENIVANI